jgi:thymidylate synthase (FAD)
MPDVTLTSEITVTPVRQMDGDRLIAAAAWATTGKDADAATDGDVARLIGMLMKGRHGSVFEFGALVFKVHAPLFVFRQFMRHRIGWSYSEASGRWHRVGTPPPLQPIFWVPRRDRPMVVADGHKPTAPKMEPAAPIDYDGLVNILRVRYTDAWATYQGLIRQLGIAAEVARAVLPLATYSTCFCQCNPRSAMKFLELRTHGQGQNPQAEIEEAAAAVEKMLAVGWPATYAAWVESGRVAP